MQIDIRPPKNQMQPKLLGICTRSHISVLALSLYEGLYILDEKMRWFASLSRWIFSSDGTS